MLGAFFLFFSAIFIQNKVILFEKKQLVEKTDREPVNSAIEANDQENRIYGAIVPHHLVASSVVEETFSQMQDNFEANKKEIAQVVILSPNHFLSGEKNVIASNWDWQTNFGVIESDKKFLEKLGIFNFAEIAGEELKTEHGAANIMPFVKYFFSKAKVAPLMIRDTFGDNDAEKLAVFLSDNLGENSLVIVSADFSHYLPREAADFHDRSSISALYNFDASFLEKMDIDTPESLTVLFEYLKLKKAQKFVLVKNVNSSDFTGSKGETAETTSYIGGYFIAGEKEVKNQASILVFGDIMLDREVFNLTKKSSSYSYPFLNVDLFMRGVDFRIANLEGPITNFTPVAKENGILKFTFSPLFTESLKERFEIFSLANNHTFNFGIKGLDETRDFLSKSQISFFGDPNNSPKFFSEILEKNGIRIGFIGFNDLIDGNILEVQEEIRKVKLQSDFVAVYAHWGNEYQPNFSSRQKQKARIFIDAGADLVLGSHPHIIQPMEIYNGKAIFYSLGNFIFDQYFSEATKEGLSIGILLEKQYNRINSAYYLFPVYINDKSQSVLADIELRKKILENFKKNSVLRNFGNINTSSGQVEIY